MAKTKADNITDTDVLEAPQEQEGSDNKSDQSQAPIKNDAIPERPAKKAAVDSYVFLLSNDKRKGIVDMDLEEDVYDPEKKMVRRMRLLRGATSIWFDEQPPTIFPKEMVLKNTLSQQFNNGKAIVSATDKLRLQALRLSNKNTDNEHRNRTKVKDVMFYEWNPAAENSRVIKEEQLVMDAMKIAMTAPMEQILPHIDYLRIQKFDEHGGAFDDEALRTEYIRFAKNNAAIFMKSKDSPNVQTGYKVRKAVEGRHIDLSRQPGMAYWADGGFISAIPDGKDPVDYLVDFANLHGENSTAFVSQLNTLAA